MEAERKGTWARVVLDSLHPENGARLTTLELNYPYIIHAEFMTHCAFARNAASSRAIRTSKMIKAVQSDPFIPRRFPRTANPDLGMNPDGFLEGDEAAEAERAWMEAMDWGLNGARVLSGLKVHKQIASRVLMPFMHIRTLASATEWENFYNLRSDSNAQDQIQDLAISMSYAMGSSVPVPRRHHLPFILEGEPEDFMASAGRCARISYLQHNNSIDMAKDIERGLSLKKSGHMSPFEHQGIADPDARADSVSGKFRGWTQFRKTLSNEAIWRPEAS